MTSSPNHVSHATAIALRDAGFPQPEPAFGQVWYTSGRIAFVVGGDYEEIKFEGHSVKSHTVRAMFEDGSNGMTTLGGCVYAPTPSDLLPLLKGIRRPFLVGHGQRHEGPPYDTDTFIVSQGDTPWWSDDNMAEALAKAYLEDQPALPG